MQPRKRNDRTHEFFSVVESVRGNNLAMVGAAMNNQENMMASHSRHTSHHEKSEFTKRASGIGNSIRLVGEKLEKLAKRI